MSRLLRVVPEPWRTRFEEEIKEAVASGDQPLIDRIDLMVWGVRLRMERRARTLVIVGTVLVAIGTLSVAWATSELGNGIAELPQHWWSTLATLPALGGLATLILATAYRPRSEREKAAE